MNKWVKPARTAIQVLIALTSAAPILVPALGLSATVGAGAVVLTVSAVVSRLMQMPSVETLLKSLNLHSPESDQSK
jgi:hypothetical protein